MHDGSIILTRKEKAGSSHIRGKLIHFIKILVHHTLTEGFGPAQEHVRVNQNPLRRYGQLLSGGDEPTIVNPADLDSKASAQVCGQCHGVWELVTAEQKYARCT